MPINDYKNRIKIFNKNMKTIKTIFWFYITQYYSGGLQADSLELFLEAKKFENIPKGERKPSLWRKYEIGKFTPKPPKIELVAQTFPESAYWFNHPIWQLLNFDFKTSRELDLIMLQLDPNVARHFIQIAVLKRLGVNIAERKYRSVNDTVNLLFKLSETNPLDTLTILVMYFHESIDLGLPNMYLGMKLSNIVVLDNFFSLKELQGIPEKYKNFIRLFLFALPLKNTLTLDPSEFIKISKKMKRQAKNQTEFNYSMAYENFLEITKPLKSNLRVLN